MATTSFRGYNKGLQIGFNSGPINLPPERPETPPNPLSTVPFARDQQFVSRDTLLRRIHEESLVPGSRIALVGLGGVGKSQLALEYSYQVRSQSPETWVFWVHASNESRFEQSFRDIAERVKIPGRQDPTVNVFELVENWLRDEKRKWVCIVDNVDDGQLLSTRSSASASNKPFLEYIPKSQNGYVIITSRSRKVALRIVDHKGLVEVKPMERSEALELLQRKLEPAESQGSEQLVNVLEFMPLAIVQAASYIRNRAPRCSVAQYLSDFQRSDLKATKLLKEEAGHHYRDWEAKNSILVTWQMSFDHIRQIKPSAADLLSLMSFFDRQGISENLLRHQPTADNTSTSELSDGETSESDMGPDFEDDVTTLRDYSFISISGSSTFTMHRLVQLTTRAWLNSHGQINQWRDKFISTLYDEFPTGEYEDWERCRPLFPHVKSAMLQRPTSPEIQLQWATLLYKGAWYALRIGNIADIREMASKSRDQRKILLGDKHQEFLDSTNMLAIGYWYDGRSQEAEQLQLQLLETTRTKLGKDHRDTLTDMANLAMTYLNQNRWEEAEQLQVQVMETRKAKFGENHSDTISAMDHLAVTFMKQGRWDEAEQLQVQVIETRKAKFGEDHPDTISVMANLAMTYLNQNRWEEAEQLQVQAMETRKAKFGADHPQTLGDIANLAVIYWKQGRWDEAEALHVQLMETRKTKLGKDHPHTLDTMSILASTWKYLGRDPEAINLLRDCFAKQKQILGLNHTETVYSSERLLEWETSQQKGARSAVKRSFYKLVANWRRRR